MENQYVWWTFWIYTKTNKKEKYASDISIMFIYDWLWLYYLLNIIELDSA